MNFVSHWYLAAAQHPADILWTGIGFFGQAMFALRFVIQWLTSEKQGHSVVPLAFWYCSIIATVISLGYGVHIGAWALLPGYLMSLPIYVRNLVLIYRDRRKAAAA